MLYNTHKPTTLDDLVLSRANRKAITRLSTAPKIGNVLLHSPESGTGKSVAASILANLHKQQMFDTVHTYQAGTVTPTTIHQINTIIRCSAMSTFVIEECDSMAKNVQASLCGLMDEMANFKNSKVNFILTTNLKDKLSNKLVNRCESLDFTPNAEMESEMIDRLSHIFEKETGVIASRDQMTGILKDTGGSMRGAIVQLQSVIDSYEVEVEVESDADGVESDASGVVEQVLATNASDASDASDVDSTSPPATPDRLDLLNEFESMTGDRPDGISIQRIDKIASGNTEKTLKHVVDQYQIQVQARGGLSEPQAEFFEYADKLMHMHQPSEELIEYIRTDQSIEQAHSNFLRVAYELRVPIGTRIGVTASDMDAYEHLFVVE